MPWNFTNLHLSAFLNFWISITNWYCYKITSFQIFKTIATTLNLHFHDKRDTLTYSRLMLKNGRTYFQNLAVLTLQNFESMFSHLTASRKGLSVKYWNRSSWNSEDPISITIEKWKTILLYSGIQHTMQ